MPPSSLRKVHVQDLITRFLALQELYPHLPLRSRMAALLVQGVRAAASTSEALKRKREEDEQLHVDPEKAPLDSAPTLVAPVTLSHEFVAPADYAEPEDLDPSIHGSTTL